MFASSSFSDRFSPRLRSEPSLHTSFAVWGVQAFFLFSIIPKPVNNFFLSFAIRVIRWVMLGERAAGLASCGHEAGPAGFVFLGLTPP